ncbi:MAG: HEAT repeat domain-containing protein [Bacteroidota bacterium]
MAIPLTPIAGKEVKFILNEPAKEIKGGLERESTLISREKYKQILVREHLNKILLNHCSNEEIAKMLRPEHEPILHKICLESVTTGSHPMIRKKAILALRHYFTKESINLLTELAIGGEDEYIRSNALGSLSAFKTAFSVPLLIEALKDTSDMVKNSARVGLKNVILDTEGKNVLKAAMKKTKNIQLKKELKEIIEGKIQKSKKPLSKPRHAKKDK